jgi:UDP-hydrolysing UDP-N-acetyl-D-glucosamine 2-epimerase
VRYHLPFDQPPLLVTFHPVTLESERVQEQIAELLAALDVVGLPVVFTAPNADTHNDIIFKQIAAFVDSHPTAEIVPNFGPEGYFSMLAIAAAMVGNSSSGLIEAASFKLPVVNIGIRQWGRVRAQNVIDVGHSCAEIVAGIRQAISPGMRERLLNLTNPYRQDEPASAVIVRRLKEVPLDNRLIVKAFYDLEGSASGETL